MSTDTNVAEGICDGMAYRCVGLDPHGLFNCWSSYPQDTPETRGLVKEIVEARASDLVQCAGGEFLVSDYVVHMVAITDPESGEVVDGLRLILPQPVGLPLATVMPGLVKAYNKFVKQMGQVPPYQVPLHVALYEPVKRRGQYIFRMSLVG